MNADRELLELAAKAAGIAGFYSGFWSCFLLEEGGEWNPRTDDGDSFRLMVKLGMRVEVVLDLGMTCAFVPGAEQGYTVDHEGDVDDATRLAILIAAAETGKTLP